MIISVDLTTIPPVLALDDADDMGAFSVRINTPDHTFVDREALVTLAGDRAANGDWSSGLEQMLAYARSKGWIREGDDAIQAHVEWHS